MYCIKRISGTLCAIDEEYPEFTVLIIKNSRNSLCVHEEHLELTVLYMKNIR